MAAIDHLRLSVTATPAALWASVAAEAGGWLARRGLAARDAVLLVPYAQLLAPARQAFAARPGWQPRIETTATLAAALAPPPLPAVGQLSFDRTLDALSAATLLRSRPFGADWARHDRRGFDLAVAAIVDAAQALTHAAHERPPAQRSGWWSQLRAALPGAGGPGALEGALLALAAAWAEAAPAPATDALFMLQPAAWIVVQAGGADALAESLLGECGAALRIDTDAPAHDPFGGDGPAAIPPLRLCTGAEQEAQAAADAVVEALNAGRAPVALIAVDRLLVRRVRALLERQRVPLADETGWTLSTTRAAGRPMAWLRAAAAGASADQRLEWLKGWPPAQAEPLALQALESLWRDDGRRVTPADRQAADALWLRGQAALRAFSAPALRSLDEWLALLQQQLADGGELSALAADPAGAQVLRALRLAAPSGDAWSAAAQATPLDLAGFTDWVDAALEQTRFVPPAAAGAVVVITPLARALLRPFAQIVLPGADERHLGVPQLAPGLIGDALAAALGLPTRAEHQRRQRLALAQLLRVPQLVLLRRRVDDNEPLAASPDVQWLALARRRRGLAPLAEIEWHGARTTLAPQPVARPAPSAAGALPSVLSASALEALRDCPYRFFARSVLRLGEVPELAAAVDKRDYGTWLHAVLDRFHRERAAAGGAARAADDAARLAAAADRQTAESGLDAADLLPFRASFEAFAPAYLAWLAAREAAGWHWLDGEREASLEAGDAPRPRLRGRIDRIDRGPGGEQQVIDYKTGSATRLRARVADPLEDTQLAFYATLMPGAAASAAYLTLDDANAPELLEHENVAASAAALLAGLADEWPRLAAGAGLPALGEGAVCETCDARGLCRRDHWMDLAPPVTLSALPRRGAAGGPAEPDPQRPLEDAGDQAPPAPLPPDGPST
jgi:ATP-dependent helicase/nuclease subunit B